MIKFPLYEVRAYVDLFEEGRYIIIQTRRTRYVLDYVDKSEDPCYVKRRLSLLNRNLPYKLYPLNKRLEYYSHLLLSKKRKFIDVEGTLITWKPSEYYKIDSYPVLSRWTTFTGNTMVQPKGLRAKFLLKGIVAPKYVQIMFINKLAVLFGASMDFVKSTRRKI